MAKSRWIKEVHSNTERLKSFPVASQDSLPTHGITEQRDHEKLTYSFQFYSSMTKQPPPPHFGGFIYNFPEELSLAPFPLF